jgi:D-alanine-D-alanine ligase
MNIGITYDLKEEYLLAGMDEESAAEFDSIETIDGIDNALIGLGHRTERIGSVKKLVSLLASGKRWDLVFNIAEGAYGFSRESQVPALLEAYGIPFVFSDSLVLGICLHKGISKIIAKAAGVATPDFAVVSSINEADGIQLPFPLFLKPAAEGTGKGISSSSRVSSRESLSQVCGELLLRHRQPVLVEAYLPGREFTVGIVGTGTEAVSVGTMEVIFGGQAEEEIYSYFNKKHYKGIISYAVPDRESALACEACALAAWRALGCRDGGRVDIRMDGEGIPNFLEVNPLAGLNPEDSDLPILAALHGTSYQELIGMILDSALKRTGLDREEEAAAIPFRGVAYPGRKEHVPA